MEVQSQLTRRQWLAGAAVSVTASLGGCHSVGLDTATPTPRQYDYLRNRRVYVDDQLSLSLPDRLSAAPSPSDADVVMLPATTERSADTVVDWFVDGKYVGLVGHESEPTYHSWLDSDAYADTYGTPQGRSEARAGNGSGSSGDGEPPELVVAWESVEGHVTTHRFTWGSTDDPSDESVFGAVNDAVAPDDY